LQAAGDRGRLVLDDHGSYWLPRDARTFEETAPGEYTLRSNGPVVLRVAHAAACSASGGRGTACVCARRLLVEARKRDT